MVFVNTRRLVERVSHQLTERLGEGNVGAHHGSLSRKTRLESGRKTSRPGVSRGRGNGFVGARDRYRPCRCRLSYRLARTWPFCFNGLGVQATGSGPFPERDFYPLTRDDLLQCVAGFVRYGKASWTSSRLSKSLRCIGAANGCDGREHDLRRRRRNGDHYVASSEGISEEALLTMVRGAYPYQGSVARQEYDQLLEMLSEGVETRRSRRSAYLHRDRVHAVLRARRGARLTAITNGGAIPDTADYDVIEFPSETFVGKVNEDFAIESLSGDIFLLGNRSWRIRRVGSGKVFVEDARGLPPTIPFGWAKLHREAASCRKPSRNCAATWRRVWGSRRRTPVAYARDRVSRSGCGTDCELRCCDLRHPGDPRSSGSGLPNGSSMNPEACSSSSIRRWGGSDQSRVGL